MATLTKKTTVYFDPDVHKVLKKKAKSTNQSISEMLDCYIRYEISQDESDLKIFAERDAEPTVPFEDVVKKLKKNGKI